MSVATAHHPSLPAAPESSALRLRHALADGVAIARRNLTHVRYVPEKLLDVTVQPIMFVLLFVYVFGSAITVPGADYVDYLMAGIFVQSMAFASAGTAVSVADDLAKGVVDRFRTLPIARSAVLVGRALSDLATAVIGTVVLSVTGLLVGWRIDSSFASAVGGFALLLLFGFAMSWLGTLIGLFMRDPEAAQGAMFIVMFPLTFVANTFVPTGGMPDWLQPIADWNPICAVTAACRSLFGNPQALPADPPWPLQHPVLAAVLWSIGIIAICLPLAVRRYRTSSGR
jgi:ABC transporter DrrB family efflux protein